MRALEEKNDDSGLDKKAVWIIKGVWIDFDLKKKMINFALFFVGLNSFINLIFRIQPNVRGLLSGIEINISLRDVRLVIKIYLFIWDS